MVIGVIFCITLTIDINLIFLLDWVQNTVEGTINISNLIIVKKASYMQKLELYQTLYYQYLSQITDSKLKLFCNCLQTPNYEVLSNMGYNEITVYLQNEFNQKVDEYNLNNDAPVSNKKVLYFFLILTIGLVCYLIIQNNVPLDKLKGGLLKNIDLNSQLTEKVFDLQTQVKDLTLSLTELNRDYLTLLQETSYHIKALNAGILMNRDCVHNLYSHLFNQMSIKTTNLFDSALVSQLTVNSKDFLFSSCPYFYDTGTLFFS